MKTTIYELLGMIKDGKAPEKVMYEGRIYEFDKEDKDYICEKMVDTNLIGWLFNAYQIDYALNEEISIPIVESKENKIEKLEKPNGYSAENYIEEMFDKINEIIEVLNENNRFIK